MQQFYTTWQIGSNCTCLINKIATKINSFRIIDQITKYWSFEFSYYLGLAGY